MPTVNSNTAAQFALNKMTATEQKLPSVSTANGTTMEDGDLPFSHALSWQPLNFRNFLAVALKM